MGKANTLSCPRRQGPHDRRVLYEALSPPGDTNFNLNLVSPLPAGPLQIKELLREAGASERSSVLGGATLAGFIASAFRRVWSLTWQTPLALALAPVCVTVTIVMLCGQPGASCPHLGLLGGLLPVSVIWALATRG